MIFSVNNLRVIPLCMLVIFQLFAVGCVGCDESAKEPNRNICISEPLAFGITDSIGGNYYKMRISRKGAIEIVCLSRQSNDTIHSALTHTQAETLNKLTDEYNRSYYRSFPLSNLAQMPNGKNAFTNHGVECFGIFDKETNQASECQQKSLIAPVIMHMTFGNRMCYVVREDIFFNDKQRMLPYWDLNKFVFQLFCEKTKESGKANKFAYCPRSQQCESGGQRHEI